MNASTIPECRMAQPTIERIFALSGLLDTALKLAVEELENFGADGDTAINIKYLLSGLGEKWLEVDRALYEGRVPEVKWGAPFEMIQ